jgi:hypothetical protein
MTEERTPAEALAFVDGYEAGLDQGRREAAASNRALADNWDCPVGFVSNRSMAAAIRAEAGRIERREADVEVGG